MKFMSQKHLHTKIRTHTITGVGAETVRKLILNKRKLRKMFKKKGNTIVLTNKATLKGGLKRMITEEIMDRFAASEKHSILVHVDF